MTNHIEPPVIFLIDEYEALKERHTGSEQDNAEASRIIHEIMLLGRAHPVKVNVGSNPGICF